MASHRENPPALQSARENIAVWRVRGGGRGSRRLIRVGAHHKNLRSRQRQALLAHGGTTPSAIGSVQPTSVRDLSDRMGLGFASSSTIAPVGVLFGSSQLIVGPDAVRDFYATFAPGTSLTWRPVYAWVTGSRDLGFTVGESVATGRGPSGAAVQRFGKYLSVWQHQRDGSWKFVVAGGNATPAKSEK
jgi:hypothetical protein